MQMRLPGLIDVHVHLREPGGTHKEDWDSGTAAALAGGFTTVLAMPNTQPPVTDAATLDLALAAARSKARCDYGQYLGAGADNVEIGRGAGPARGRAEDVPGSDLRPAAAGRHDGLAGAFRALARRICPIVAHAESRTLAAVILLAALFDRSGTPGARLAGRRNPADPPRQGARAEGDVRGCAAPPLPEPGRHLQR